MEEHIEKFLNKISVISFTISTILLLRLFLQTPQTCIPPNTPSTKPHLKFPSSTCDTSLLRRPYLPLSKSLHRLHSSRSWLSSLSSFSSFFLPLCHPPLLLLHNHSRILCVSAGAGHPTMALHNMGVSDVTAVELVESLPLVRLADPHNLPFFDGVFDLAFSAQLEAALFPSRFVGEMERTVRKGGVCVVAVEECGAQGVDEVVGLFRKSKFLRSDNVSLIGLRMTRIIMRVDVSS